VLLSQGGEKASVDCSGLVETDVTKIFPRFCVVGSFGCPQDLSENRHEFLVAQDAGRDLQLLRRCHLCQRAKPAQDTRVGLHSASPSSQPMEKLHRFCRPGYPYEAEESSDLGDCGRLF